MANSYSLWQLAACMLAAPTFKVQIMLADC